MRRTPALILGAGPAGTAAAITLAAGGTRALILERQRETGDALCGGFLSWRSLATLATLGIPRDALNPVPVTRVRIFGTTCVAETTLPAPAIGVSRRHLDTLLLDRAIALGVWVVRGVQVRHLDARTAHLDGDTITGDTVFLATGKHDLRGAVRPADARGEDPTMGLRLRLPAHPSLARMVGDAIELHPFRRGYAGIVAQEDGSVNLCMAVHRSRLRDAGDPATLLAELGAAHPRLGDRLAFADGRAIDAIANVPYGWRATGTEAGVFRLGDQAGVIPSLAGEGMGIALATGRSAAQAWASGMSAEAWQHATAARLRRPLAAAGLLRTLAEGPAGAALAWAPAPLIHISAILTRFAA